MFIADPFLGLPAQHTSMVVVPTQKTTALVIKGVRESYCGALLSDRGLGTQISVTPNSMLQHRSGSLGFLQNGERIINQGDSKTHWRLQ